MGNVEGFRGDGRSCWLELAEPAFLTGLLHRKQPAMQSPPPPMAIFKVLARLPSLWERAYPRKARVWGLGAHTGCCELPMSVAALCPRKKTHCGPGP